MGNKSTRDKLISDALAINSGYENRIVIHNNFPNKDFKIVTPIGKTAEQVIQESKQQRLKEEQEFWAKVNQAKLEKARKDEERDYLRRRGYL